MKKILLITALAVSLTACGNVNSEHEKNALNNDLISEINNEQGIEDIGENTVNIDVKKDEVTKNKPVIDEVKNEEVIDNNIKKEEIKDTDEKNIDSIKSGMLKENNIEETKEPEPEVIYEEGVEVGNKAIDFEVELLSGEKVKLSNYLGKPIFLNFWATWCGPCVREMPDIEKIKTEYGDNLVVLAINGGELKEDVEAFINKKGFTFNIGINESGDILEKYDSMYIPLSVFIDKDGVIRERKVGTLSEQDMKNIVESLSCY